ncbi:hypothetical protein GVAV_001801 [Gurleya vavrai]
MKLYVCLCISISFLSAASSNTEQPSTSKTSDLIITVDEVPVNDLYDLNFLPEEAVKGEIEEFIKEKIAENDILNESMTEKVVESEQSNKKISEEHEKNLLLEGLKTEISSTSKKLEKLKNSIIEEPKKETKRLEDFPASKIENLNGTKMEKNNESNALNQENPSKPIENPANLNPFIESFVPLFEKSLTKGITKLGYGVIKNPSLFNNQKPINYNISGSGEHSKITQNIHNSQGLNFNIHIKVNQQEKIDRYNRISQEKEHDKAEMKKKETKTFNGQTSEINSTSECAEEKK